jgi:hypothetical protein
MGYTLRIGGCDSNDRGKICKALDQRMKKPGHKKVKHWELRKVRGLHESIYMVPKKAGQPPDDDDFEDAASVTTHGWIKTATFDIGAANLPARCTVYYKDTPLTFSDYGWDPARSAIITSLYMDECYQSGRGQRHQQFGIPWSEIYNFVWIVMEPVLADLDAHGEPDEGSLGCYPTSSRTHLFWQDSTGTGLDLPWDEWAKEFVVRMDAEVPFLAEAIRNHISTSTKGDTVPKTILRKVADQFLGRFKPVRKKPSSWRRATAEDPSDTRVKGVLKRKKDKKAETRTEENGTDPGSQGGQRGEGTEPVEPSDGPNSGQKPGENAGNQSEAVTKPGELTPGKGTVNIVEQPDEQTLPEYRWVPFSTEYRPQLLEPGNADLGVVWIDTPQVQVVDCNVEHNVYTEVVDYWTNEFGTMFRDIVVEVVQDVYGTSMSTAVAHILEQKLDDDSRAKRLSELTTKFYGLYDQHDHIGLRIRGRLGRGAGGSTPGTGRRIAKRVAAAPEPDEAAS